jgi:CheY-like chemotaxis protein
MEHDEVRSEADTMHYVLIVQDEPLLIDLVTRNLDRDGYCAYGVANSAEALDVLRDSQHLPCLILLDLCTPVMDGIAFRREQKADIRLAAIPVVVFSSYSNVVRYGAQGLFEGYVSLPFEMEELISVVGRYWPSTG